MTVFQSVHGWLTDLLSFQTVWTFIDLEKIPNDPRFDNAGIFSSPNDIHTQLMGGQVRHTEFKSFYLRRPFSQFNERLSNETFIEKLRGLVYERNLDGIMPKDGRDWVSIEVNGGIYPAQQDQAGQWADYLIPLKLVYVS